MPYNNYIYSEIHSKPEEAIEIGMLPLGVSLTDLFAFDIETTGTDPETSVATILGGTYFEAIDGALVPKTVQLFLQEKEFERELFELFHRLIQNKKYFISFNGDGFDVPYVESKFGKYGIPFTFTTQDGMDFYKWAKRYQSAQVKIQRSNNVPEDKLKKPFGNRLTLKAIEKFAGIERDDTVYGVTMIDKYHQYEFYHKSAKVADAQEFKIRLALCKEPKVYEIYTEQGEQATREYLQKLSIDLREELLLHNREDTYNLLKLFGNISPTIFHKAS